MTKEGRHSPGESYKELLAGLGRDERLVLSVLLPIKPQAVKDLSSQIEAIINGSENKEGESGYKRFVDSSTVKAMKTLVQIQLARSEGLVNTQVIGPYEKKYVVKRPGYLLTQDGLHIKNTLAKEAPATTMTFGQRLRSA